MVRLAEATALVRDLVDTPAADLGPAELEAAARDLAKHYGAKIEVTSGDALSQGYPMIAAVGQGAIRERSPRLIELRWGKENASKDRDRRQGRLLRQRRPRHQAGVRACG